MKKFIALAICLGSFTFLAVGQSPQKEMVSLFPILLNGKWGYINANGDVVIEPQFDSAGEFREGLAVVTFTANAVTSMGTDSLSFGRRYHKYWPEASQKSWPL
jgi:hypothetical protein